MAPVTPRKDGRPLKRGSSSASQSGSRKKPRVSGGPGREGTSDEKENVENQNDQLLTPINTPTKQQKATAARLDVGPTDAQPKASGNLYARASARLRVSSTSTAITGRDAEAMAVRAFLDARLARTKGARKSMYVSGPPGIGKTALLSSILGEYDDNDDVLVVMDNCASAGKEVWSTLAQSIGCDEPCTTKTAFARALKRDKRTFIVCLDEIDHLIESCGKDTLNALFQLAHKDVSNLVLIGIANALDLTVRHLDRQILSGSTKDEGPLILPFQTYDAGTLSRVVQSRLGDDLSRLIDQRALDFAAKKVAAQSGDVRVLFAVTRKAFQLASESKTTTGGDDVDLESATKVTMQTMLQALRHAGLASLPALSVKLSDMTLPTRCALLSVVMTVRRAELDSAFPSPTSSSSSQPKASWSLSRASSSKVPQQQRKTPSPGKGASQGEVVVSTLACYSVYRTVLSRSDLAGLNVAQMTYEEYLGLVDSLDSYSLLTSCRGKKPGARTSTKFKPVTVTKARAHSAAGGPSSPDDKHVKLLHDRLTLEDALEEAPKDASNAVKVVVDLSRTLLNDERARTAVRYAAVADKRAIALDDDEAPREFGTRGLDLDKAYLGARN